MLSCISYQAPIWTQMMATKKVGTHVLCQNSLRSIRMLITRGLSRLKKKSFGKKRKNRLALNLVTRLKTTKKNNMNYCWITRLTLSWPICCRGLSCQAKKGKIKTVIVKKKFYRLRRRLRLWKESVY